MSLINEALKRAEADKLHHIGRDEERLAIEPVRDARPPRWVRRWALPAAALALLAVGWIAWSLPRAAARPQTTSAGVLPDRDLAAAAPQFHPAPLPVPKAAVLPADSADQAGEGASEAELALRKTIDHITYYDPKPASRTRAAHGADKAGRGLDKPNTGQAGPALPAKPTGDESKPASDQAPAASAEAITAKPTPPAALAAAQKFRLSGVMHGPFGATALINGHFVSAGATIDGAKVVQVNKYTVVLEMDGKRFTLRI